MSRLTDLQRFFAPQDAPTHDDAWERSINDVKVARGLRAVALEAYAEGTRHGEVGPPQLGQIPAHLRAVYLAGWRKTYVKPAPRKIGRPRKVAS